MGALTSNRKRGDDYFRNLSSPPPFEQSYGHISKRPKLSDSMNQTTAETTPVAVAASNYFTARIARYPEKKSRFPREVHAPVSHSRFRSSVSAKKTESAASSRESPADKMGKFGFFSRILNYNKARDSALRSFRYYFPGKENEEKKEVIELDSSEEQDQDAVSDDSSIEEVEIVDSARRKGAVKKEVRSLDSSVVTDVSNPIAKVDDRERNGLSLLDLKADDDSGVPPYKRLYANLKKRDTKLKNLNFDIEIQNKKYQGIQSLRSQKKEEPSKKELIAECFVHLTEEEKAEVSHALSNSQRRRILVAHANSGIDISGETLQCLRPGAWLNDEVINVYLELLKEREKRMPEKFLKCHFFNTFFYKKLISGRGSYNFQSVRRWTTQKKLGYSLLECDKIFVPIHKEIHWCLAVINKKDKKFQYLDSLGGRDNQVLNALAKYFVDEVKDKCGKDIDLTSWEKEFVTDLPEQLNGYDCGMFMIKYADFYSRDIGLCFSQDAMPYFRERTAKEILKLRAD